MPVGKSIPTRNEELSTEMDWVGWPQLVGTAKGSDGNAVAEGNTSKRVIRTDLRSS